MSVGKSTPHDSSVGHVTGASIFIDDRPQQKGEVHIQVVGVPRAAGRLINIFFDEALKLPGVIAVFTAKDLYHNKWGSISEEQPILVSDKIGYIDEPACLIVADNTHVFHQAKKLIQFDIEDEEPVFSILQAIEKNNFICNATPFIRGNASEAISKAPHKLSGEFIVGGQEHFYLESQATIAYPLENGQLEIHSSSQHPTETQHICAHAVGIPFSQVVCVVKRMGGGFGGKETQAAHFAAMAALVAFKLKKPARLVLTKDDDMMMTGKRHPFLNYYDVGFDQEGRILGLKAKLYANGGAYCDLTPSILDRAMFHIDGCYYLDNFQIEGWAVRTNVHSNTAFRGFGGPQGNMTIESIIEDIAIYLKKDALDVRKINLYGKESRNITPYGQVLENNLLPEIFENLALESDYKNRQQEIIKYNSQKNGKVRGISLTGCKFGIAFTARFLNQANALVNLHVDGTIQVSTGGTEMGQGLNTKMQQIAAHAFGINPQLVQLMPTSTEKNHNTSPTAASSGTDINGAAVLKACEAIKLRLSWVAHLLSNGFLFTDTEELPVFDVNSSKSMDEIIFENSEVINKTKNKKWKFSEIVKISYFNRVSLGEYSFFKTEGLGFNKKTSQGTPFKYFTNGAAVSEVEIDEYTGEMKILRADILMDLGRPINPGIDVGQVSGAYVQGAGWVSTENLFYAESGKVLSHSPTTYKIPNIQDTPRVFNIRLIENNSNTEVVHKSKAVGEPPLLLGSSVWTATKHALSFRMSSIPKLTSPCTPEVILMEMHRE